MPPITAGVITSSELGLERGDLVALDKAVSRFGRKELMLRTITVLHAFSANLGQSGLDVNRSFQSSAPTDIRDRIGPLLASGSALFIEPLQQLVVLRRAMTVCDESGELALNTEEGFRGYFDMCRLSADVLKREQDEIPDDTPIVEKWLRVAAGMMPRLWLVNPVNPNYAIARRRITLDRIPESNPELQTKAVALKERFESAIGVGYDEVSALTAMIAYFWLTPTLETLFGSPGLPFADRTTWAAKTKISATAVDGFLARAARPWDQRLRDDEFGGPLSLLPFRDRPLVMFPEGQFVPVMRELLLDKLTAEAFWWLKDPDKPQDVLWQQSWGELAEAYILSLLKRIAEASGCNFKARVKWDDGEVDGVMWFKGHVALFEVTASGLTEASAEFGEWGRLRDGLHQAFVESKRHGKAAKREAVLQLERDIRQLLEGRLGGQIPVPTVIRVYPVMIALDRRTRAPGVWHYLEEQLAVALADVNVPRSALALMAVEDIEGIDQSLRDDGTSFRGTPPGLLRMLRRWDIERGVAPSFWQFVQRLPSSDNPNEALTAEGAIWLREMKGLFDTGGHDLPAVSPE